MVKKKKKKAEEEGEEELSSDEMAEMLAPSKKKKKHKKEKTGKPKKGKKKKGKKHKGEHHKGERRSYKELRHLYRKKIKKLLKTRPENYKKRLKKLKHKLARLKGLGRKKAGKKRHAVAVASRKEAKEKAKEELKKKKVPSEVKSAFEKIKCKGSETKTVNKEFLHYALLASKLSERGPLISKKGGTVKGRSIAFGRPTKVMHSLKPGNEGLWLTVLHKRGLTAFYNVRTPPFAFVKIIKKTTATKIKKK